jgi:hypothetical protein
MSYFGPGADGIVPLDIFFTHAYQYVLEEDITAVTVRLASFLARSGGTLLAENGFRMGHPWGLVRKGIFDNRLAYLSGALEPMAPLVLPPPAPGEPPQYRARTLVDIRIRPNVFLVLAAYAAAVLLVLDFLGIELFLKSAYLLRIGLVCLLAIGAAWSIFFFTAQLRKQFEASILEEPGQVPA